MLRKTAQARAATATTGGPWLRELQAAVQWDQVFPHVRLHVIADVAATCGGSRELAAALEEAAYATANGQLRLYMPFVQELLARPGDFGTVDAFDEFCRRPDQAQVRISEINAKREAILEDIASCQLNIEEGTRVCPRCKCRKLLVDERQTRGADEETTKFYTCTREECQHRFR